MFQARGEHRFSIPDGSRWSDVLVTNLGERLTAAMRAVPNANEELRGVFTVDWAQPASDGWSGEDLRAFFDERAALPSSTTACHEIKSRPARKHSEYLRQLPG